MRCPLLWLALDSCFEGAELGKCLGVTSIRVSRYENGARAINDTVAIPVRLLVKLPCWPRNARCGARPAAGQSCLGVGGENAPVGRPAITVMAHKGGRTLPSKVSPDIETQFAREPLHRLIDSGTKEVVDRSGWRCGDE